MIRNSQTDIRTAGQDFDRVISTIPSVNLGSICHPLKSIFSQSTASTVCVVNLFYKETDLKSAKGFGYLIPKSIPKSQNPEGALGVVFDSDATPELDEAPGTKLTVMLGGPAWKGVSKQQLPSNEDAIDMAQNVIMSHLGITQKPVLAQANLHTDCIPQYTIGHRQRMQRASEIMTKGDEAWMGSVRVAGSSYGGVGVNDCIENAWYTTAHLRHRTYFGNETACVPRVWSDA